MPLLAKIVISGKTTGFQKFYDARQYFLVSGSQGIGLHHKFLKFSRLLDTQIYFTAVRLLSTHLVSSAILSYGIYFFISANVLIGHGVVGLEYNIFHVCSAAFRTPGFFGILVFCKLTFLFWQVFLSGVVLWG